MRLLPGDPFPKAGADLVRAVVETSWPGRTPGSSRRFHRSLAAAVVTGCLHGREATGLGTVALSGGG